MQEKDLNLRASKYMYKRLQELGIPSVITRDDDMYLPKEERVRKILSLYNNDPNVILVSNHINAGGGEGAEIVYSLKNNSDLADLALKYIVDAGQIKRKVYQRRLPENPNKDYYYILRETGNLEPILVEYGFIDNKNDAYKLKNNLEEYVEGVVKAIAEYAGYKYRTPNNNEDSIAQDIYIVQKGDTLYSISRRFNIPVDTIKSINNLNSNILSIGQKIKLTEEIIPENTSIYIVQKGDTLYKIATQFNMTVNDLKIINNLSSNTLSIGQELIIVDNNISDNSNQPEKEPNLEDGLIEYVVQKGDSLWQIAKTYNMPVNELININNLSNLTLQIGQILLVPQKNKTEENSNLYTVKKGDTLWSIAKENEISVAELKELNNLTSNMLSINQILKLR